MPTSAAEALSAGRLTRFPGAGGVSLAARLAGPEDAPPIVLVHGFSQGALAWIAQLDSILTEHFRLVAVDLRGHGASAGGPPESYADGAAWAADLESALVNFAAGRPAVLVGWSYGGRILCEYVRRYGTARLRGLVFVGATGGGGTEKSRALLGPGSAALPAMVEDDPAVSIPATRAFLEACVASPLPREHADLMLAVNARVSPATRRAMLGWVCDFDDLLPTVALPTLVIHGAQDTVVRPESGARIARMIPGARLETVADAGHCVFLETPDRFNALLAGFAAAP